MNDNHPSPLSGLGPVDWGLGANLLRGLAKTILYGIVPDLEDGRDWMSAARLSVEDIDPGARTAIAAGDDYWFDVIADTGDSQRAMYSVGYLVHGDLFLVAGAASVALGADARVAIATVRRDASDDCLPRGRLLFIGGDTAYSIADERTLKSRLIAPLDYAHWARFGDASPPARPLLGLPGNHDWYDSLDGFNRLFRRSPTGRPGPLSLRGLVTVQEASYFALALPYGWDLWAIDARDGGDIDFRQREFFRQQRVPAGLVIATPSPVVGDGRERAILEKVGAVLSPQAQQAMRLWFSGDYHHYARYSPIGGEGSLRAVPSVVCGLGGASLHAPTQSTVRADKLHPAPREAARRVLAQMLSPAYMLLGTNFWTGGALLGLLIGAGASALGETADLLRVLRLFDARPALEHPNGTGFVPWVLLGLIAGCGATRLVYLYIKHAVIANDEATARQHSLVGRMVLVLSPLILMFSGFIFVAALSTSSTYGGLLLDIGFYVSIAALLFALPSFLASGFPAGASLLKKVAAAAIGIALAVLFVTTVLGAVQLGVAAVSAVWPAWAAAASLPANPFASAAFTAACSLLAAAAGVFALPVLLGLAFAAAFVLGARRTEISSFAAIDAYQAFIRFRVRRGQDGRSTLTGYVIAVDTTIARDVLTTANPNQAALTPSAFLLDVFTVE
jgi:hypothetical protein